MFKIYLNFKNEDYNIYRHRGRFILNAKPIDYSNKDLVIKLYRTAFPHRERDSIHKFLKHDGKDGDILVFYDEKDFVGFACLISFKDITHILYIAIDPSHRDKGYGHQALELVKETRPNNRFIVDVEQDEEDCINHDMRVRRKLFYMHDAFNMTDIKYQYNGVNFVIMSAKGSITYNEFIDFWSHFSKKDDLGYYIVTHFQPQK